MARILDFYGIAWEYEPHTFPILWNLDGDVVESFSPDFYLEELDLYLELTTLRQKLVRKKNRKLRRLRELYPAVHIKLFYARDFRALMLKYGKLALADALTGTAGQSAPPDGLRSHEIAEPEPAAAPILEAGREVEPAGSATLRRTASRRRRRRRASAAAGTPIHHPDRPGNE